MTVSNNLTAAIQVCQELMPNELIELQLNMKKKKKAPCQEQWLSAIEIKLSNLLATPFSKN